MKLNVLAIVGLVIMLAFVVFGFFIDFDQAWMLELVGVSVGLALVISTGVEKQPVGSKWKAYLIGIGVSAGAMVATFGGIKEDILISLIGAVMLIAAVILGIIKTQNE